MSSHIFEKLYSFTFFSCSEQSLHCRLKKNNNKKKNLWKQPKAFSERVLKLLKKFSFSFLYPIQDSKYPHYILESLTNYQKKKCVNWGNICLFVFFFLEALFFVQIWDQRIWTQHLLMDECEIMTKLCLQS